MLLQLWWIAVSAALGLCLVAAQRPQLNAQARALHRDLGPRAVSSARAAKGNILVSTADGYLHLIDGSHGARGQKPVKRWSTSIGLPMVSSFQSSRAEMLNFAIVPTVDGSILIRTTDGMRKIPMKARVIADRTPFVANDGTMYTGSKKSRIFALDANTGRIVQEVSDEGAALVQANLDANTVLWVTRIDYSIRAFAPTGTEQWNVTFSEVVPLTAMMARNPDIARPPDPLVVTPDGELVFSDPISRSASTVALSAPATGAFSFSSTLMLDSLSSAPQTGPFTAHQLEIVYRAPKSAEINGQSYNAVVRSLQDNQFYAVVLAPQTTLLPSIEASNQLSTIVRPDMRTTSPLVNPRNLKEHRTWLSWLHQQSETPLTPVFLSDEDKVAEMTNSECTENEELVDNSCLLGIHPIISEPALDVTPYGVDPGAGYDLGWPYPALPFHEGRDNSGFAVDVYHPDTFHNGQPIPAPPGAAGDWWTVVNQLSSLILVLLVIVYGLATRFQPQIRALLKRLGLSDLFAKGTLQAAETRTGENENGDTSNTASDDSNSIDDEDENEAEVEQTSTHQIEITDEVLGYGAHGTVVFRGQMDNRPVAVKRMVKQYYRQALREIRLLIQSDGHPHVVRYYLKEERQEFVFLALQLCETSLHKFIAALSTSLAQAKLRRQNPNLGGANLLRQLESYRIVESRDVCAPFSVRKALVQAAEGVAHLHSLRIVHRDVKPQNILLAVAEGSSGARLQMDRIDHLAQFTLKISDMGLGKQLDAEGNSTSLSTQVAAHGEPASGMSMPSASTDAVHDHHPLGTIGWQAPELMVARRQAATLNRDSQYLELGLADAAGETAMVPPRHSEKVDIFSLGCVFYSVLVPMEHPFGEWYDRESKIMHNQVNLSKLEHIDDAHDLISKMIQHDPADRPTAAQVCKHPFFWSEEKRLSFLLELSDRLENEDVMSPLVLAVESNAINVVGQSWEAVFHAELLEDVAKYRKYDTSSVRDCLRLIRNKRHHFHELPDAMKQLMSPIPEAFLRYFESRLPKLLMHCVRAACQHLALQREFSQYCFAIAPLYRINVAQASETSGVAALREMAAQQADEFKEQASAVSSEVEEKKEESPVDSAFPQSSVILWSGSALTEAQNCRGWWRPSSTWRTGLDVIKKKSRPTHLQRASAEPKFRTRLCTHWDNTKGQACPMRKKGKCDFAHGPLELRVKENRRSRWGQSRQTDDNEPISLRHSGGEDPLGAARSIEQVRQKEGSQSEFERSTKGGTLPPAGNRGNNSQPRRPRGK